jgi:beta-1,4-mannosyltransferase
MSQSQKKIGIFVIGDIGRSPRMVNHAVEFSNIPGKSVEIVGLMETELPAQLKKSNITVLNLPTFYLRLIKLLPSIVYLVLRMAIEFLMLIYVLFFKRFGKYELIFVQNPPAIPLLPALFFYKVAFGIPVHVDVHNFGYTLFQTTNKRLLAIMKALEIFFIRITSSKIYTVSRKMKQVVETTWRAKNVSVLYDQPNHRVFNKFSLTETHQFLLQIEELKVSANETVATVKGNNSIIEKSSSNLLFIVSSSWSADDNFPLLINAMALYQRVQTQNVNLIFVFTGTGPLKSHYASILKSLQFKNIKIILQWFKTEDYPKIVACADYGISLHDSTSGCDLPIKILDYFGCEVPAIAYYYTETISELVVPFENGFLFTTEQDLCDIFTKIVSPGLSTKWKFSQKTWEKEWNGVVRPGI